MIIYKFITPIDPITFKADDDKIAFICAFILGDGKAGCTNTITEENLPSILMFSKEPEKEIENFLGQSAKDFLVANKPKIAQCFQTFCYGKPNDRHAYDHACEAISDPERLKYFRENHASINISSINKWVQAAWKYAELFQESKSEITK